MTFPKTASSLALVLALLLGACAGNGYGPKQTGGAVIGAAAGGLLGSKIGSGGGRLAATAAGTLVGLVIGSEVGASLDRIDRMYAARAQQAALETRPAGHSTTWVNPDSGNAGSITPTRTYRSAAGGYCREYQHTVIIGGREERGYGRACRRPDGSWRIAD